MIIQITFNIICTYSANGRVTCGKLKRAGTECETGSGMHVKRIRENSFGTEYEGTHGSVRAQRGRKQFPATSVVPRHSIVVSGSSETAFFMGGSKNEITTKKRQFPQRITYQKVSN